MTKSDIQGAAMSEHAMNTEVGYSEFTYTLADLQNLRECLRLNGNTISRGARAFISEKKDGSLWPWIEFAEKIKEDHEFPEKHFSEKPKRPTHFTISPK